MRKIEHKGFTATINADSDAENPREDGRDTLLFAWRGRSAAYGSRRERNLEPSPPQAETWAECGAVLRRRHSLAVMLPVFLYEHSGVALSTQAFSCPWDSRQIGWIGMPRSALHARGIRRLTADAREGILRELRLDIETLSLWASGEVYCVTIENAAGSVVDSLGGLYGLGYAEETAREMIDSLALALAG